MAEEAGTDLLGELPLDIRIRTGSDSGQPIMITEPEGTLAKAYQTIAKAVSDKVTALEASRNKASQAMPNIVME